MVYTDGSHLVADRVSDLHRFATNIGLRRDWFHDKNLPHYYLAPRKVSTALTMGAKEISTFDLWKKSKEMFFTMFPTDLKKEGFTRYSGAPVDYEKVMTARKYISENWLPSKRLNKYYNSHTVANHLTENLKIEISGGEIIAAAILEKYKYEASVRAALFYAEFKLPKAKTE